MIVGLGGAIGAEPLVAQQQIAPEQEQNAKDDVVMQKVFALWERRCFRCHGTEKQEGGLRLDVRSRAIEGGDSGRAWIGRDSQASLLIQYVTSDDESKRMPPEGTPLDSEEVRLLREWIDGGARWPESFEGRQDRKKHWAFEPIVRRDPPQLDKNASQHPIDCFVRDQLTTIGLNPSPQADRSTLIRRLALDLTGLLPTPDEVDSFLRDASEEAYEKVVDHYLASPHFGERWGRHWLDMARYADSDGYEKDNARPEAYMWRDWVIESINQDMPFDVFTIEQLAGDLLPQATARQRLATAFHRQTLTNTEGGTDQEQFRVEACFDRAETTASVWLGLTMGCARCHSHKYDPITQREYYQLFAFYNNADEQTMPMPKSEQQWRAYLQSKSDHDQKVEKVEAELTQRLTASQSEFEKWCDEWRLRIQAADAQAPKRIEWKTLSVRCDEEDVRFEVQKDSALFVSGVSPDSAIYTLEGHVPLEFATHLRLEAMPDAALPDKGPGRAKGNFVLSEVRVEVSKHEDFREARTIPLEDPFADFEQAGTFVASNAIDSNRKTGWAIGSKQGAEHWIEFRLGERIAPEEVYVRIQLEQFHGKQHTLGRFRVAFWTGLDPLRRIPKKLVESLRKQPSQRSASEIKDLQEQFQIQHGATKPLAMQLQELRKQEPAKPEWSVRVLGERTNDRRKNYVLRRGDFLDPLKEIAIVPNTPSVLPALPTTHEGSISRLELAKWLVSRENPLTARVTVNHIWKQLFGAGIVRTVNDFGVRGDPPTHPELLDWLASEFMGASSTQKSHTPWSRKRLIKTIVMSETYRQSSKVTPELLEKDPSNRWLGRQSRFRVEGEVVRDLCLDASGLLARKVGGPSVFPSLPPGIAELSYAGNFKWTPSEGEDRYRRGMYTFFKRTSPHPSLITFDCPDANLTCLERTRSNTPLQALVTLNNDAFVEAARGWAARLLEHEEWTSMQRIDWAYRIGLSRGPSDYERAELLRLLSDAREYYSEHVEEARQLRAEMKAASSKDQSGQEAWAENDAEIAAWVALTRVILNLDEFLTRE